MYRPGLLLPLSPSHVLSHVVFSSEGNSWALWVLTLLIWCSAGSGFWYFSSSTAKLIQKTCFSDVLTHSWDCSQSLPHCISLNAFLKKRFIQTRTLNIVKLSLRLSSHLGAHCWQLLFLPPAHESRRPLDAQPCRVSLPRMPWFHEVWLGTASTSWACCPCPAHMPACHCKRPASPSDSRIALATAQQLWNVRRSFAPTWSGECRSSC